MSPRKTSFRRWCAGAIVVLLLTLCGARLHLKWRVHRAIERLEESGAMVRFDDFFRVAPPIAPGDNAAVMLTEASAHLPLYEQYRNAPIPYVGNQGNGIRPGEPWPEEIRQRVDAYLSERREGMTMVSGALKRDEARYFSHYNPYDHWDISFLSTAKRVAWHLRLDAEYAMETGDDLGAVQRVIELFRLQATLHEEPLMINQLVAFSLTSIAQPPLEQLLGSRAIKTSDLRALREIIRSNRERSVTNFATALDASRMFIIEGVRGQVGAMYAMRPTPRFVTAKYSATWNQLRERASRTIGIVDRDFLKYMETMDRVVQDANTLAGRVRIQSAWNKYATSVPGSFGSYITSTETEGIPKFIGRSLRDYIKLSCAELAVAGMEFQTMNNGRFPDSWEELVPEWMEDIPLEPYSGEPFEIFAMDDGFGIGRGTPEFRVKL